MFWPVSNNILTLVTVLILTSHQCRFLSLDLSSQDNKNINVTFLDIVMMFVEFISFLKNFLFYRSMVDLPYCFHFCCIAKWLSHTHILLLFQLLWSVQLFCDSMNCSLPGSSVHGIFQARILEWVAIYSSRRSSWPRDQILVSCISCIGRWILYHCAIWETSLLEVFENALFCNFYVQIFKTFRLGFYF